ncbi:hypothetical protein BD309DRAFT_856151 [Dichomitus squalens]|nr:hypothetical protein BD309DRAFT_856151 [Dichomitus squalens]
MATASNRRTLCTCPTCKQLDPIGQWIPTTTSLDHERHVRMMGSLAYQRGRGRGTVAGSRARGATSRARGATLRGTRGAMPNLLRGGRGAPPAQSGADSQHNSSVQASVPMKRARTPSPLNTPLADEVLDPSSMAVDELRPADVAHRMDGAVSQVDVEEWQDMITVSTSTYMRHDCPVMY